MVDHNVTNFARDGTIFKVLQTKFTPKLDKINEINGNVFFLSMICVKPLFFPLSNDRGDDLLKVNSFHLHLVQANVFKTKIVTM